MTTRCLCVAWAALAAIGFAGCGESAEKPLAEPEVALELETLRWTSVPDAASYRVRGWSGSRLLFEVSTGADSLPWTPSLVRAVSAFDTVVVRVQGLDGPETRRGDVHEIRVRPSSPPRAGV